MSYWNSVYLPFYLPVSRNSLQVYILKTAVSTSVCFHLVPLYTVFKCLGCSNDLLECLWGLFLTQHVAWLLNPRRIKTCMYVHIPLRSLVNIAGTLYTDFICVRKSFGKQFGRPLEVIKCPPYAVFPSC